jgi:hypothetical protein
VPDLLILSARADSCDVVARLSAALEEHGKDTRVDLDDIPPASSWNDDLPTGIAVRRRAWDASTGSLIRSVDAFGEVYREGRAPQRRLAVGASG